jgi:hypothetical protein
MKKLITDVPVPWRMAHLPLDGRGYPIPYTVLVKDGRPHFTINVEERRLRCLASNLCPICGLRLLRGRWFVGGPLSAIHRDGAYNDPPMHDECAHYALQVCPWLAAPSYSRRIEDATLKPESRGGLLLHDPTTIPTRPLAFVAVMTVGQKVLAGAGGPVVKPSRPYRKIEFWREGVQLDPAEGLTLAERSINEAIAAMKKEETR